MIFDKNAEKIEKILGYSFRDRSLLRQAFTRTSYANEHKPSDGIKAESNEVLEFFGDSILSAIIVTLLMKGYTKRYRYGISTSLKEGDFSNIKSKLSDKKNLSRATKKLGLEKYLLMGEGDEKLGIQNEPSVMEDLFESIVGAIYIDSGNNLKTAIDSVEKMLDINEYLEEKSTAIQSYKNLLQELCQDKKLRLPQPTYKTISEKGPDHKREYERGCYIGDKLYGIGVGKSLKHADAQAAELALAALKKALDAKKKPTMTEPVKNYSEALKRLAEKAKKPAPEFRDLGETPRSNDRAREYKIECRFDTVSAIGVGKSKREAKAKSAELAYKKITAKRKDS